MTDTITGPIHCFACNYDLRGLSRTGRCPECGLFVAFTLEQRYTDEYFAAQDSDTKRWREQMGRAEEDQQRQREQVERFDRILNRWETIQDRVERLLDRSEGA